MTSQANEYAPINPRRIGCKCMVFPDKPLDKSTAGSRYIWGKIVDVCGHVVTVEITETNWSRWKKYDQIWFRSDQVWPLNEQIIYEQLSLF